MKRNPLTLTIGVLLILIVALLLFVFQVRKTEVAVVTTFGKPTRDISAPGAYFKWPWPIQSVHRFDQRVQNFDGIFAEGQTADSFSLLTQVFVGWKITEPKEFFPKFAGGEDSIAAAEQVLERLLANAKAGVIGKHPLADFLATGEGSGKLADIEAKIFEALQSQVRSNHYGISIEFLGMKKLGFPESVTQSVFARMSSERQVLISKSQFEGEAEAQKIRSEADRQAIEELAKAEIAAGKIRGMGEAEAAQYLSVFQQNPELAIFIFRLNALESSLKEKSTLIFDQQTPPFDLFRSASTNLVNRQQ
jgi:membrane protease subunit HflC